MFVLKFIPFHSSFSFYLQEQNKTLTAKTASAAAAPTGVL
jgi:hypothetical protein